MAPGIDMRKALPFGLKRYSKDEFEELHRCGSNVLTASLGPALFGESRFAGRFAALAHIAGIAALRNFSAEQILERGNDLEPLVIKKVAKRKGWKCWRPQAWAAHPDIPRLIASPDALSWDGGRPELGFGIGEVKVVDESIFEHPTIGWLDGPPLSVRIQHQLQLACCKGALWGWIGCQINGRGRWETIVYDAPPEPDVIDTLLNEPEIGIRRTLADLDAGELGEPDTHETSLRAAQSMWHPIPGKTLQLNDPEYDELFDRWVAEKAIAAGAEQKVKGYRSRFAAMAKDNNEIRTPGGRVVKISRVHREASTVPEATYTKVQPVIPKEDWVEI